MYVLLSLHSRNMKLSEVCIGDICEIKLWTTSATPYTNRPLPDIHNGEALTDDKIESWCVSAPDR